MSKEQLNTMDEPIVEEVTYAPDEVLAKIVKRDDGYHVVDKDGTEGDVLQVTKDGISFILTPNAANRKFYAVKKVEEAVAKDGYLGLTYKATVKIGSTGSRSTALPNAKLIAYLPEAEQEEYKAIIARAIAARDADKKKPMTAQEKLEAMIAKLQAKLASMTDTEVNE